MALAEAGYPNAIAEACDGDPCNFRFDGAPHAAIYKAGELVAASWRLHERGET